MHANSSLVEMSTGNYATDIASTEVLNFTSSEQESTTPPPITSPELSIVNFTIGTLGIADNMLVIIVILASSALRKQLNIMFILNQSVIDMTVASFLIATTCIRSYEIPPGMIMGGELYCRLWLTKLPLWGMMVVSTYNLLSLTIERYLAMIYPVWHKVNFTRRKAVAMMAFGWVFGICEKIAYMTPTSVIRDGFCHVYRSWPSQQIRNTFGAVHAVFLFFLPLGTLIFCYGRIILMLRKRVKVAPTAKDASGTAAAAQNAGGQEPEDRWSRAHRNTIKTLMIVSCCFAFCWSWNQIYFLLMNFGIPDDYTSDFYHFTVIAIFFNCCINPIIYSLKYEQFQREAKRLFLSRFQVLVNANSTTTTSNDSA